MMLGTKKVSIRFANRLAPLFALWLSLVQTSIGQEDQKSLDESTITSGDLFSAHLANFEAVVSGDFVVRTITEKVRGEFRSYEVSALRHTFDHEERKYSLTGCFWKDLSAPEPEGDPEIVQIHATRDRVLRRSKSGKVRLITPKDVQERFPEALKVSLDWSTSGFGISLAMESPKLVRQSIRDQTAGTMPITVGSEGVSVVNLGGFGQFEGTSSSLYFDDVAGVFTQYVTKDKDPTNGTLYESATGETTWGEYSGFLLPLTIKERNGIKRDYQNNFIHELSWVSVNSGLPDEFDQFKLLSNEDAIQATDITTHVSIVESMETEPR